MMYDKGVNLLFFLTLSGKLSSTKVEKKRLTPLLPADSTEKCPCNYDAIQQKHQNSDNHYQPITAISYITLRSSLMAHFLMIRNREVVSFSY